MSWGSTAYTPIVIRNTPPFGFHETQTPPDFTVCNQNPWITGELMKRAIQDKLKQQKTQKTQKTQNMHQTKPREQRVNEKCMREPFSNISTLPYMEIVLIIIMVTIAIQLICPKML